MSDFKHEFRYYVIKRRDITSDQEVALQDMLHDAKIPCQESVVVENDWPNYEHTWATIQRVSDGTYDDPYAENGRLRARVAELEAAYKNATMWEDVGDVFNKPTSIPWLLRKQAEAVEDFLEWANDYCSGWAQDDAGRTYWHDAQIKGFAKQLRQRADEIG